MRVENFIWKTMIDMHARLLVQTWIVETAFLVSLGDTTWQTEGRVDWSFSISSKNSWAGAAITITTVKTLSKAKFSWELSRGARRRMCGYLAFLVSWGPHLMSPREYLPCVVFFHLFIYVYFHFFLVTSLRHTHLPPASIYGPLNQSEGHDQEEEEQKTRDGDGEIALERVEAQETCLRTWYVFHQFPYEEASGLVAKLLFLLLSTSV